MSMLLLLAKKSGSPPTITVQPTNQIVTEGATATFTVTATGATSYQWEKADVLTPTSFSDISGATSSSYTTPSLTIANDNGDKYRVKVTNANGTTTSNTATLTVGPV